MLMAYGVGSIQIIPDFKSTFERLVSSDSINCGRQEGGKLKMVETVQKKIMLLLYTPVGNLHAMF